MREQLSLPGAVCRCGVQMLSVLDTSMSFYFRSESDLRAVAVRYDWWRGGSGAQAQQLFETSPFESKFVWQPGWKDSLLWSYIQTGLRRTKVKGGLAI